MTNVSASIKSGGASLGITAEPTRAGVDASQPTLEAVPGQHKTPPRKKQASRQRRWVLRFFGVTVGALLLVAACGGDGTNPSAGSPSRGPSAARGDFADTVDIGTGRKIYMECHGSGRPTVVLISGYGDRGDIWRSLSSDKPGPAVYAGVGKFTRVCAYDRPGTHGGIGHSEASRSTPVPQPVAAKDAAADLRALLTASELSGPYVLVGHSYGGAVARLYASAYPNDVAGLVLVDAFSEDLPNGLTVEQWATFQKLNSPRNTPAGSQGYEALDWMRVLEQVRGAPRVRSLPVIVLSADQPQITPATITSGLAPGVTQEFADAVWASQIAAQDSLAKRFAHAKHITNTKSTHYIQFFQPQLVIDSIHDVAKAVRNGKSKLSN